MPSFSLLGLPSDLAIALSILAFFLVVNYTIGKHRPATILLSLYVSGAVVAMAPVVGYLDSVLPVDARYIPVAVYLVMTVLVFLILRSNRFFEPFMIPSGWELGMFALFQTTVLVSLAVGFLPETVTGTFSPNFARVFADGTIRSALLVLPLVGLFFVRGND